VREGGREGGSERKREIKRVLVVCFSVCARVCVYIYPHTRNETCRRNPPQKNVNPHAHTCIKRMYM
jgi:hypothetical protein